MSDAWKPLFLIRENVRKELQKVKQAVALVKEVIKSLGLNPEDALISTQEFPPAASAWIDIKKCPDEVKEAVEEICDYLGVRCSGIHIDPECVFDSKFKDINSVSAGVLSNILERAKAVGISKVCVERETRVDGRTETCLELSIELLRKDGYVAWIKLFEISAISAD